METLVHRNIENSEFAVDCYEYSAEYRYTNKNPIYRKIYRYMFILVISVGNTRSVKTDGKPVCQKNSQEYRYNGRKSIYHIYTGKTGIHHHLYRWKPYFRRNIENSEKFSIVKLATEKSFSIHCPASPTSHRDDHQ